MPKTQNSRDLITELVRTRNFEPKMLEQKVFSLWRQRLGTPLGTNTTPVSISDGILKVYTEYPSYKKRNVTPQRENHSRFERRLRATYSQRHPDRRAPIPKNPTNWCKTTETNSQNISC